MFLQHTTLRTWMLGFTLLFGLWACDPNSSDPDPVPTLTQGVFITNEGGFMKNNASLSYYDLTTEQVSQDVYQAANGSNLGDILQSMTLFNDRAYLVVNNSGKVEVAAAESLDSLGTITGLTSPRYLAAVSDTKAYCTDLFAGWVWVLNLATLQKVDSIAAPGQSEGLIVLDDEAFVTRPGAEYVYVINTTTDAVVDSVNVGEGANSVQRDANGKLWVACGFYYDNYTKKDGRLVRFDPATRQVEQRFDVPDGYLSSLQRNGAGDTLYYMNGGDVFRTPIVATALTTEPLIAAGNRTIYGLGVDPTRGEIYVSDAADYVQRGTVYRYDAQGNQLDSFQAGIIPGSFVFRE
ncbi:hypothetical protein SAMN05421823_101527 [Catalinimonas alkaloidigena]|uniref:40-residue YVTN family beta-propeller repeat-containing protein n=1 Tax=Catalinimonas alkaloidigena TaxID=1075417 RepID=A0A1G8XZT0_9BACT|nr:DUF5074 domain-containing protein [Catalinimonas alkaloidigena]SDJ96026.1 hypothetical protein SAMN05421823_101527 [Catalinimonas alkaloidigena]